MTVANAGGYSTTAILATGAEPVFTDIDPATMLVDTQSLSDAIAADTVAIVVTHLYGRMVNMPAIAEFAQCAGIPVVEDCAQAHGARMNGKAAGAWGTLGCFSFYPTKNLGAMGDGGAVVTSDSAMAGRVRELRQYGWTEKYHTTYLGGRNSRLDEIQGWPQGTAFSPASAGGRPVPSRLRYVPRGGHCCTATIGNSRTGSRGTRRFRRYRTTKEIRRSPRGLVQPAALRGTRRTASGLLQPRLLS
jgi:hypothetical protein